MGYLSNEGFMDNIILNIPHASTVLPIEAIAKDGDIEIYKKELLYMTDWYTDTLFQNGIGTPVVAPVSRLICDTERFRNDEEESMSKIGMGAIYTSTHNLEKLCTFCDEHREAILSKYYDPHHKMLELYTAKALDEYNKAIIIDCHSFSPYPLRYEPEQDRERPDICIGTDNFHTPKELESFVLSYFNSLGYSTALNKPYSGTIVPMKYYQKEKRVQSIMIEINRGLYLKKDSNEKSLHFEQLKKEIGNLLSLIEKINK